MLYTIIAIVVVLLGLSLRVVKEYERGVIFFLGKCKGIRGPGLIILIPIFEQMTRVQLRTVTMNIPSQKIITTPRYFFLHRNFFSFQVMQIIFLIFKGHSTMD